MSDKTMDRIQKLLNQAAGAGTDAERDTFQAKADELMHAHKIDAIMLKIRQGATAPKSKTVPVDELIEWISPRDEFIEQHRHMVSYIGRLAGVRLVFVGSRLHIVGYPDDIAYFRMLWVSTHLTFSGKLNPEWRRDLAAGDNIRAYVECGFKWAYIWNAARRAGQPLTNKNGQPVPSPPLDNGWMKRALGASYRASGEERPHLTHAVRDYRNSYASAFAETVALRADELWYARRARENGAGSGVGLVLATDANAIQAHFDRLYSPESLSSGVPAPLVGSHAGAALRGRNAGRSVDFSGGRGGVGAGSGPAREIGHAHPLVRRFGYGYCAKCNAWITSTGRIPLKSAKTGAILRKAS